MEHYSYTRPYTRFARSRARYYGGSCLCTNHKIILRVKKCAIRSSVEFNRNDPPLGILSILDVQEAQHQREINFFSKEKICL